MRAALPAAKIPASYCVIYFAEAPSGRFYPPQRRRESVKVETAHEVARFYLDRFSESLSW